MKKTLLVAMTLCSMISGQAKEITETQAAKIASEFVNNPSNGIDSLPSGTYIVKIDNKTKKISNR